MSKVKNKVSLYAKDSRDAVRVWSIWSEKDFLIMEYGVLGGELQINSEPVAFGLAGRTKKEQIKLRVNSRVNKKLDQGYCEDLDHAINGNRTNTLGYKRPMNAVPLTDINQVPDRELFLQLKLNGHRCLIKNDCGEIIAYSKGGKLIETIPEILSEIDIPEGTTLDGELYHHGTPLQTISSWVRRRQENTKLLNFKCFDAITEGGFSKRRKFLKNLECLKAAKKSEFIKTKKIHGGEFDLIPHLKDSLENGYEGLMLRCPEAEYQDGKRNKAIMKVKRRTAGNIFILDDEFLVVNIKRSVDGWARLVCETEKGIQFLISAPGDVPEKTRILERKDDYIGKHIRVEFEGYTKSKKPVEAVAVEWREKHEE